MTTDVMMPTRKWGDEEELEAPRPTVLVSSRDGAAVPKVRNAALLARLAESHGWAVRQTYALAAVPEQHYKNGNLAHAEHRLHSVAVRLWRAPVSAYAVWYRVDGGKWRFASARRGMHLYGLREFSALLGVAPLDFAAVLDEAVAA